MAKKEKIMFVVTQGCYSDYHIIGVFSSRYKARNFIKGFNTTDHYGYEMTIETYPLDKPRVPKDKKAYYVEMNKNGNTKTCVQCMSWYDENIFNQHKFTRPKKQEPRLIMHVLANDKQHAVKIVNEKRTQLIANNQWGQNE